MKKNVFSFLFIIFIFLNIPVGFGLPPSETDLVRQLDNYPEIVASCSIGNITKSMLLQELNRTARNNTSMRSQEDFTQLLQQLILALSDELLLRHHLKNDPLAPSPELVQKTILANPDETLKKLPPDQQKKILQTMSEDPARQFQVSAWLWIQRDIMPKIKVTPEEVEDFYRKHQNQFLLPPETSWQCIIAHSHSERDRIAARLAQLESFADLAGEFPPPDQGELDQFWQLPSTAEALSKLKTPGQWTQIAGSNTNTLFIMLRKKGMPSYLPLTKVHSEIREQLKMTKIREQTSAFFSELREKYHFQIHAGPSGTTQQKGNTPL